MDRRHSFTNSAVSYTHLDVYKRQVVRRAEDGEKFVTLDGQEREMDSSVLMICDGEKSIGVAAVSYTHLKK